MTLAPDVLSLRGLPGVAIAPGTVTGLDGIDEGKRAKFLEDLRVTVADTAGNLFRVNDIPVVPFNEDVFAKARHASFGFYIHLSTPDESEAVALSIYSRLSQMTRSVCTGSLIYPVTWSRISTGLARKGKLGPMLEDAIPHHLGLFIEDWHQAQLPEQSIN